MLVAGTEMHVAGTVGRRGIERRNVGSDSFKVADGFVRPDDPPQVSRPDGAVVQTCPRPTRPATSSRPHG